MRARLTTMAAGCAVVVALAFAGPANAATTVGNNCSANEAFLTNAIAIGLANDPSVGLPSAIPSAGVITGWTFQGMAFPAGTSFEARLVVLRPTGMPKQFSVVGLSDPAPTVAGLNVFSTRIPVQSGDVIAESGVAMTMSKPQPAIELCTGIAAGNVLGAADGAPSLGALFTIKEQQGNTAAPITVKVEADADGDGFGDETQDSCPDDPLLQSCPTTSAAARPPLRAAARSRSEPVGPPPSR